MKLYKLLFLLAFCFLATNTVLGQSQAPIVQYFFVDLIPAQPDTALSQEELVNIQKAHLANIRHLVKEGKLLLAGPFQDGGGLFILNVADRAAAEILVKEDPAVKAGRFDYNIRIWYTEKGLLTLETKKEENE